MVPILSQMNPVHALPLYFFKKLFNIILLSMLISLKDFLPSDFATKTLYVFPYCPHACYMPNTLCLMTQ